MGYKYETHMHTAESSACGRFCAREMVQAYKAAGYAGIFVTDHFFNGNCTVDRRLPWADKVELFCKGYENAKAEGDKIGLDVFFGFEYCVEGADFLGAFFASFPAGAAFLGASAFFAGSAFFAVAAFLDCFSTAATDAFIVFDADFIRFFYSLLFTLSKIVVYYR